MLHVESETMRVDPAAALLDSLLSTTEDSGSLATYLAPDWDAAPALNGDYDDLVSDLLDLTSHAPSSGASSSLINAVSATPDTYISHGTANVPQHQQPGQLDKHQIKLNNSRESQKRSRERQKVKCVSI